MEQIRIISPAPFLNGRDEWSFKSTLCRQLSKNTVFISLPGVGNPSSPSAHTGSGPGDLGSDRDVLEALQLLEPDEEAPLPMAEA